MGPEQVWGSKTDDEVLAAARTLAEYTEEGEWTIRAELKRRGLPEPASAIGRCARCGRAINADYSSKRCPQCGAMLSPEILPLLRDGRGLSATAVLVISGVIAWPLWLGTLAAVGIYLEEILGWKQAFNGPKWIPQIVAVALFGAGFFIWKIAAVGIRSRWGQKAQELAPGCLEANVTNGQTVFHAINVNDPIVCHNLKAFKGRFPAMSALRRANPALALAMSPYEASTRERPKEECFEQVRARQFPRCPSRLGCFFLFPTRESAERCSPEWFNGARVILEAQIVSGANVGIFDARHLDAPPDRWEVAARRYWAGELTADPRPEVLVDGEVQLVGWEPHARLGL